MIERPLSSEYDPFYAGYIALAGARPLRLLKAQVERIERLRQVGDAAAGLPPKPGEWSLKEVLVHLCDFERVFAYRALRFSRGDEAPLETFDQDQFVANSEANGRELGEIVDELIALRRSTIAMFESLTPAMRRRGGIASGAAVTVRALVFIVPGHCEGHLRDARRDYGEQGGE